MIRYVVILILAAWLLVSIAHSDRVQRWQHRQSHRVACEIHVVNGDAYADHCVWEGR